MRYEIHPDLAKILIKLYKKDPVQREAILKKMDEIVNCEDVDHYKNLRAPLNRYKRVHIASNFALLFRLEGDTIIFRYHDHHDFIYRFRE